ncbi:TolB family protein [Oceanobacillus timonensis]|uniref:TolB family protein n=1 Tax=Oceanobacillus timonensis TaxID=1926285 RepID=UPI0009BA54BF|nr:DPP IV N-terminal domain-containing protein [Oceanobacillus timonensis]
MTRKRILLTIIGMIFVLLAGTILYGVLRDDDPYRYFTGLGEEISVAPDDSQIAFSYYVDGEEAVYTANPDGTGVEKIADAADWKDSSPAYSPDGHKIAYLSENPEGMNILQVMNQDGSEEKQLTDNSIHVMDSVFSNDGETLFFVAIDAEGFNQGAESESSAGFDLFSVKTDGSAIENLTDADYPSMDHLSLSPDGQMIYFSAFDGEKEQIFSYSLEDGTVNESPSVVSEEIANSQTFNKPQLSPNGEQLVFTDVSEETQESSLFEYELFLLDMETQDVERLTDLGTAVDSPVFFHEENKIAFLENTNWSSEPAEYQLMTIDTVTHDIETIELDAPQSTDNHQLMQLLDRAVNSLTLAILYTLLISLLSVYLLHYAGRAYLASIISFSIAIIVFAASFAVAAIGDPWFGIGLGMLAAGIFGCSIIVLLFILIYKQFVK